MRETIWVLAYILRFEGENGEWAQVVQKAHRSEQAAYAAREATGTPTHYSVCKVEIDDD